MTRTDALTILNACFPEKVISTLHSATKGFEHDFYVIREQLLMAILLNYNQCVWKSFVDDPDKFQKKYQESELLKEAGKKAVEEFFKKDSITIPANEIPKEITNETELHKFALAYYDANADQTFSDMHKHKFVPFYEFWNVCCDVAGIPKDKRETADYTLAKVDAFIYFNALFPFYGQNIKDWETDMREAKIEVFTRKDLAVPIELPDGETFGYVPEFGLEGTFFKCNMFDSIITRLIVATDIGVVSKGILNPFFKQYPEWNWHRELPTSLMYNPTNKVIKQIVSSILLEQTKAIQIISSEKDFWGNNWVDSDSNIELKKIAINIELMQKDIQEINHPKSELQIPEPYRTAVNNSLIKPLGDGLYSPLMALDKMLSEWNRIRYEREKTSLLPFCQQFRETIIHGEGKDLKYAGKQFTGKAWSDAINTIPWEDYSD